MEFTPVERHFDKVAESYDSGKEKYSYYYSTIKKLLANLIGKQKTVIEYGCGTGDLLASLNPKVGFGYDLSSQMIQIAKAKHNSKKNLFFSNKNPNSKSINAIFKKNGGRCDYIFMTDVIEHLEEVESVFKQLRGLMTPKTVLINTMANPLWEPLLMLWEKMGWKMKEGPHKRISYKEIMELATKSGLKIVKHDYKLLVPIYVPFVTDFINKYLEKYLKPLCFIEYFVAVRS